ncbi:hypothetical protein LCGC14_2711660 [marine sediment metagenome]|uniref:Uncharacterized protein n=1 Tax=marine sediment metagenome TaxID=412755 RepID=A0A0F9A0H8_9ZZZZ
MSKRIKPLTEVLDGIDTGTELNINQHERGFDMKCAICKSEFPPDELNYQEPGYEGDPVCGPCALINNPSGIN